MIDNDIAVELINQNIKVNSAGFNYFVTAIKFFSASNFEDNIKTRQILEHISKIYFKSVSSIYRAMKYSMRDNDSSKTILELIIHITQKIKEKE